MPTDPQSWNIPDIVAAVIPANIRRYKSDITAAIHQVSEADYQAGRLPACQAHAVNRPYLPAQALSQTQRSQLTVTENKKAPQSTAEREAIPMTHHQEWGYPSTGEYKSTKLCPALYVRNGERAYPTQEILALIYSTANILCARTATQMAGKNEKPSNGERRCGSILNQLMSEMC